MVTVNYKIISNETSTSRSPEQVFESSQYSGYCLNQCKTQTLIRSCLLLRYIRLDKTSIGRFFSEK